MSSKVGIGIMIFKKKFENFENFKNSCIFMCFSSDFHVKNTPGLWGPVGEKISLGTGAT